MSKLLIRQSTMPKANTIVGKAVTDFLRHLCERNSSPHTVKAYSGDLAIFSAYAGSRGWKDIDHVAVRGFLSQLYEKGLSKTSVARALAAVRSLYRWLAREGVVEQNPAKLVSTPKLPKKLPRVPTIEEMNSVLDGRMPEASAFPERDQLMLELLYGCGIRNSELTGINIDDIRLSAEAILIRGKGKKERYVPFGGSAKSALIAYLPERRFANQPARRTTHHTQRRPHREKNRHYEGVVAGCSPTHFASRLWHPHAGRRRRPARHSGTARPRAPGYYAALHPALDETCVAGVRPDPSESEVAPEIPDGYGDGMERF